MNDSYKNFSIEEIEKDIRSLGSDHVQRFGGDFQGGILLQQDPLEFAKLIHFLLHYGRNFPNFLEIGSAGGGACFVLNKYLRFDKIVIIDDNQHRCAPERVKVLKDIDRVEFVGDSHCVPAVNFVRNMDCGFDLIMIDGDHSFSGVKADFENYNSFLKPSGLIIFHDIAENHCGVKTFAEEIDNHNINLTPLVKFIEREGRLGIGVYAK